LEINLAIVGFRKNRHTGKTIPIVVPVGRTISSRIFPNTNVFQVAPKNALNVEPESEDELFGNEEGEDARFAEAA
jgi:hypothetical protein